MTKITIINTNARSLKPKIDSLLDCINETEADFAVLTETWLQEAGVSELKDDLSRGAGLGILARNRRAGRPLTLTPPPPATTSLSTQQNPLLSH